MTYNQMMRKAELNAEYGFTGVYFRSYESDKMKEEKKRPEFKGYKTRIVREEGGVSLYVENKYFEDKAKRELQAKIDNYENRKANAFAKYQEALKELEAEQADYVERLSKLQAND